ncbi:MAG: sodium:alanine symporter family protein [Myxococcota bacterium]
MEALATLVDSLNGFIWSTPAELPWLVVLLLGTGLFVTARLGLIQVRKLGHAVKVVAGKYDDPNDHGDITHFQALSTALSATVGIGNIAGVATAIHYGGPGAIFWMWLTAFFGMALKYSECTLAVHYRVFDDDGFASGGPMYYMERGLGPNWRPLAVLFAGAAAICSFATGNMNQANTVAVSATTEFGVPPWIVGLFVAVFVGAVILGGIRRIASVSSTLAPSMAALYVAGALVILVLNADKIPGAFMLIVSSAFNPAASVGGSVAGIISVTLLWGVKRGLFSNEAGQGSAPIAHAAAKTDEPVREGAVAMLEPLIDTLIICTMTALVIIATGVWDEKHPGQLRLGEVKTVPTSLMPSEAKTEYERITTAMTRVSEEKPSALKVDVDAGRQSTVTFIGRDGIVEDVVLKQNGQPFTGVLSYDPMAGTIMPDDLQVHGNMLQNSSALTALAFKRGLSPITSGGNYIVTLCVFLFALSTMISWSYYGDRCVTYLFGASYVFAYRLIYVGFSFLGCILALEVVWSFGDLALGIMSIPNLIAVLLLSPKLVEITRAYFNKYKDA